MRIKYSNEHVTGSRWSYLMFSDGNCFPLLHVSDQMRFEREALANVCMENVYSLQ